MIENIQQTAILVMAVVLIAAFDRKYTAGLYIEGLIQVSSFIIAGLIIIITTLLRIWT